MTLEIKCLLGLAVETSITGNGNCISGIGYLGMKRNRRNEITKFFFLLLLNNTHQ